MITPQDQAEPRPTNYSISLKAEMRRVTRCFNAFSSEQRANHVASHRLGYQQRLRMGDYFYTHPDVPNIAFPTRGRAAKAALARMDG